MVEVSTHQLDMDVGETFLNFPLHTSMRPYCGVNLANFDDLPMKREERRLRFSRLSFGLKPSPHGVVRFFAIAEGKARGDHLDSKKPFLLG